MAKYAQKILHFYCFKCKDYELKTSPHYRAQKQRFARRRRKEREAQQTDTVSSGANTADPVARLPTSRKSAGVHMR
jgi:hypothetical protein